MIQSTNTSHIGSGDGAERGQAINGLPHTDDITSRRVYM